MTAGAVAIHRLRAQCPAETEPVHARLRLSYLLSTVEFHPSGMPPGAILLLRRVRVPLPISLDRMWAPPEWQQSLQDELDRHYRWAVRSSYGIIPPGAEAVLFEDVGEQMAILGILVGRPAAESVWVWSASIGPSSPSPEADGLTGFWLREPRFVPDALRRLEEWSAAQTVVRALRDSQVQALFAAVTAEFDLSVMLRDLHSDSAPPSLRSAAPMRESELTDETADRQSNDRASSPRRPAPRPPEWFHERRRVWSALSPAAQSLLTLGSAITESRSRAQTVATLNAIRSWLYTEAYMPDVDAPEVSPLARPEPERDTDHDVHDEAATAPQFDPQAPQISERQDEAEFAAAEPTSGVDIAPLPGGTVRVRDESSPSTEVARPESRHANVWDGLDGIRSGLAGTFFLLNYFLRLNAPACFDAEFGLLERLTVWGLMEGFARSLLSDDTLESDSLWSLLPMLDGREPHVPIAADLPDRESVLKAIYARLNTGLAALLQGDAPEDLLRRSGVVYVGRIHLDVVMGLNSIWMPARRAGLDATPGWLPQLMRVVTFHFV